MPAAESLLTGWPAKNKLFWFGKNKVYWLVKNF